MTSNGVYENLCDDLVALRIVAEDLMEAADDGLVPEFARIEFVNLGAEVKRILERFGNSVDILAQAR